MTEDAKLTFAQLATSYDAAAPGSQAGSKAAAEAEQWKGVYGKSNETLFFVTAEKTAAEHRAQTEMLRDFEAMYPKSAAAFKKAKGL